MGTAIIRARRADRFVPINAGWKAGRGSVRQLLRRRWTCPRAHRASTARSAGSRRSGTRLRSRSSTPSGPTRSTDATASWRSFPESLSRSDGRRSSSRGHRSTIVSTSLGDATHADRRQLKDRGVLVPPRTATASGVHFYNHEDDVEQVTSTLAQLRADHAPVIARDRATTSTSTADASGCDPGVGRGRRKISQ